MSRAHSYRHEFVRSFPERLQEGVLYVSVDFDSAAHRCFCGCGQEVYTRLSPRDWMMIYDGKSVSLDPSIGNWSFACRSHYWLDRGRVTWAAQWTRDQIERGRTLDRIRTARHYGGQLEAEPSIVQIQPARGLVTRFWEWLAGK